MLLFVTGIIISIIIARFLGPKGKGIYSLAVLLPSLVVTLVNFGIGSGTVYYLGRRKYTLEIIFGNNLIIGLLMSIVSLLGATLIIVFFRDLFFKSVSPIYLFIAFGLIPFFLLDRYLSTILLGLQKFLKLNLAAIFKNLLFLCLVSIILIWLKMDVIGAIYAHIFSSAISVLIIYFWIYKIAGRTTYKLHKSYIKDVSLYGIKVHAGNILAFLNYRFDMLLINAFLNPIAVGYYSISVGIAEKLWIISQSASAVLFPRVASEKDEKRLKEFTPIISRNIFFLTIIGAIIIFFISRPAILFLYSDLYLSSVKPLQILLPGIVALSISRVLSHDIAGRGKPMLNTYIAVVTVSINVSLNILWIPKFGMNGAALASTIAYNVDMIGKILLYRKISGNSFTKIMFLQKSDFKLYKRQVFSFAKRLISFIKK